MLLPLIWIISALWAWLGRYRLAFYLAIGLSFGLSCLATRFSNPFHTYDVVANRRSEPLKPHSILQPQDVEQSQEQSRDGEQSDEKSRKNLIIVAASGGGILAAGWTAQVLTKLHTEYPNFAKELRLISGVSGGSVGAAHYVNSVSEILKLKWRDSRAALNAVAEDAMRSSLASTSYGLAFPDFRRAIFPFWWTRSLTAPGFLKRIGAGSAIVASKRESMPRVQSESSFENFAETLRKRIEKNWFGFPTGWGT